MHISLLSFRHLPKVMDIEQRAYPWPWTEGMFVDSLRNGHLCYCIHDHDTLLGYIILFVAAGESHVLNVCVDPDQQGRGIGRRLLEHGLAAAMDLGAEAAFLEVRVSNDAAIRLYERNGFLLVGRRKQYYPAGDTREDALVYRRDLCVVGSGSK
ncbi:MAG: ribosomal protein S18-alanine N-acetyltransferase [Pseudomonadota bacterium]|nr:ribosomal protein S18-alanine N-acetyltransferase [Pseudomonadota bacterium]